MEHRVFSLKYRPSTFEELVGQPHVRQTLVNTLLRNSVSHGYIFSGPRGVGKTSVARLFAKALNCAEGPAPGICNTCSACQEITSGTCLDVIEMDGASNRKIEDVRALRENVRFAPASCRYKIYIIDEVHMLTQEAFNALLKTLEEPPAHVVFILATTDPQKIPETIHSRCQELEFHRIAPLELESLLRQVCKKEKVTIDPESVSKLAEWADGSARDGLVALEQAAAFSNGDIQEELVDRLFGWVGREMVEAVISAVMKEDRKALFEVAKKIEEDGKDVAHFLVRIARWIRTAWVSMVDGTLPHNSPLHGCDPDAALRMVAALLEAERNLRGTRQPGLFLSIQLIQLIELKRSMSLSDIVRKLDDLESRIAAVPSPHAGDLPRVAADPSDSAPPVKSASSSWPELLAKLESEDKKLSAWLKEAKPTGFAAGQKILSAMFPKKFLLHHKYVTAEKNAQVVDAVLSRVMGQSGWHLQVTMESSGAADAVRSSSKDIPPKVRAASEILESRGVQKRG